MKYGVKDYEPHKIKALSLIKITEVLVSQKKYDKALNQALQILKLKEPHPAMLYVLMGRIFCAQELWGNAIFWLKQGEKKKLTNDYKDLVKFNENDFKKGLYDWWGYALFRKKDYLKAIEKFDLACKYEKNQKEVERMRKNKRLCLKKLA